MKRWTKFIQFLNEDHSTAFYAFLVFGCILFAGLWWLGKAPLAGTEGHRAIPAHQMAQSGDWLLPKLYDQLYLRKPPLHYWTLASFEKVTGSANEWIWRFPSVLASALLGAFICFTGARWFGSLAGPAAGFSYFALVALWTQTRAADVDALNTLFSVLTACALIELNFNQPANPRKWTLIAGLSFGAALLTKGPACLPIVLGSLIGPSLFLKDWQWVRQRRTWFALGSGIALFLLWVILALVAVKTQKIAPDLSGFDEAVGRMLLSSLKTLIKVILLPLVLLVYALPVSLALPLSLHSTVLSRGDDRVRKLIKAIVGCLIASLLLGVISGMTNPRYGYVALPMLCFLCGAVAVAWQAKVLPPPIDRFLLSLLAFCAVLLAANNLLMMIALWKSVGLSALLLLSVFLSLGICGFAILAWLSMRPALGAWALVVLILLMSIPFDRWNAHNRTRRSGQYAARLLRQNVGNAASVKANLMITYQPELFYYAGLQAESFNGVPEGKGWIVVHHKELQSLETNKNIQLSGVAKLPTYKIGVYSAYYTSATNNGSGKSTQADKL